jgi:hypothetical protein
MEVLAPAALLAFVINKVMDWLKDLVPDRLEARVLNPLSWLVGIGAVLLFSQTDYASSFEVGNHTLANVNIFTLCVIGFMSGAAAGVLNDIKPNRLTGAQMQQVADQARTVMIAPPAADVPPIAPATKTKTPTKRASTTRKAPTRRT